MIVSSTPKVSYKIQQSNHQKTLKWQSEKKNNNIEQLGNTIWNYMSKLKWKQELFSKSVFFLEDEFINNMNI